MMLQNKFYQLKLGLPGTSKSEFLQGEYGKLVIPAAANDYMDAVVAYVESWTTIYVQLPNAYRTIAKMHKELQEIYRTTKSFSNPISGSSGIMKYDLQNECYRILIIKRVDPTVIRVRFVDFGYTDVATKQQIHPISKSLTNLPAQAFPIRIELKDGIAGSMSLNAFRKYLTNAQVIIQLGNKIVNDSFMGIIYLTDENNKWYSMNEAVESKISIKKLMINHNDNTSKEVIAHINDFNEEPVMMVLKPAGKINVEDKETELSSLRRKFEKKGKIFRNFAYGSPENSGYSNAKYQSLNETQKMESNTEMKTKLPSHMTDYHFGLLQQTKSNQTNLQISSNSSTWIIVLTCVMAIVALIIFLLFTRKQKWILSKITGKKEKKAFTNDDSKADYPISFNNNTLDGSAMTSQTTSSNSWKNAKKEGSIEIVNDRLTAEDLSSVIGLMAYGSLLKDIDKNVRRRGSRKYAGRSVTDFNLPLSASSSSSSSRISINYSKNTRRIMEKIVKNQANNMNNSLSEREIQECSENFTYKSTNDDDHSNSSVCSSLTTLNDTANRNRKRKVKWKNHKNDRKNDRIVRRDAITDNDQLFSCVSVSNTKSSTKSYHSSEGTTTNIIAGEITPDDDESMRSTIANNSSLARKLIHTWIRKNDDKKGMNDSYDSTQQNLTMQQNSVSRAFSSHQSNSALRAFPECQLDSISRDRKQSSSSSAETINSFSNENMGQNKYPYANSIHSSDFEIPSYLNTIPISSYNQQLTYEAPQLTDDIRRWTPSESERMNSTQTNISSNRNYSESTRNFRILSNSMKINDRIHSGSIQSIRIPSTYQLENIPKFSQLNNVDYFTSESFYQGREQICHQSGKYTSILSTIPLKTETYTASEGSRRCSTDYEPSLPYTSAKNQQIIDCCTNFEQSIESHSTTDVQHSHPELSKITSISSELSAISNCSNSGKELKLLDEKVEEMEQSSSVEEGLKMKMNITLMPQRYQSLDEHIEIEEHHSDQESTPIGSISSYHSTATTTTYESTQDLSIIK